jgi:enamine deaminase RidA (YjgF/YER057c/UK114 family)
MNADDLPDRYRDGSRFETVAAYARAARHGSTIVVSGTAAMGPDGAALHPGDTYAQTTVAFAKALEAVAALGGTRETVFRTRVYLVPEADWQGAVRAHQEAFAGVDPANTTVYAAAFIPAGALVEVEVEAGVAVPPAT